MSEKRFERWNDYSCKVKDNQEDTFLNWEDIVNKLNEQQATIEMYQRRVDKREEQISIIKKHCLKFLTDEQIEITRKELENE